MKKIAILFMLISIMLTGCGNSVSSEEALEENQTVYSELTSGNYIVSGTVKNLGEAITLEIIVIGEDIYLKDVSNIGTLEKYYVGGVVRVYLDGELQDDTDVAFVNEVYSYIESVFLDPMFYDNTYTDIEYKREKSYIDVTGEYMNEGDFNIKIYSSPLKIEFSETNLSQSNAYITELMTMSVYDGEIALPE